MTDDDTCETSLDFLSLSPSRNQNIKCLGFEIPLSFKLGFVVACSFPNCSQASSVRFESPRMSMKVRKWVDQCPAMRRNVYFYLFD